MKHCSQEPQRRSNTGDYEGAEDFNCFDTGADEA